VSEWGSGGVGEWVKGGLLGSMSEEGAEGVSE
jgi:hypothetical protein